jgi:hypothetical protein
MSGNAYLLLLLVVILIVVTGVAIAGVRVWARLRSKGYRSPFVVLGVASVYFASFALGFILFSRMDRLFQTNDYTYDSRLVPESLVNFGLYFLGPVVAAAVILQLLAAALRPRQLRTFGARRVRFPWKGAGYALFALGGLWMSLGLAAGIGLDNSLRPTFQLFVPAGAFCFYMARRSRLRTMEDALRDDLRPPVLYLRAFNRETEVFAELTLRELEAYTSYVGTRIGATFEQYLSRAISEAIGPFVALGSPEDYLPPEGAARRYADDRNWMDQFRDLSHRAVCILMQVDHSDNLRWELQSLRDDGLRDKLFIVTPPARKLGWRHVRIHIGRGVMSALARLKGVTPVSWPAFVDAIRGMGYSLDPADPGPGAVIAITQNGHGVPLTTNACSPADFVAAIQRWQTTARVSTKDHGSRARSR